jgi:glutathione S-transferase
MSYELYTLAGSCSMSVHAVMNELGLNPKVHIMEKNDGPNGLKSAAYLSQNPRGNAPFITEDGNGMIEGAAIITYLCDKEGKLIPKTGFARAQALQWLMFCNATLHPAYNRTFWLSSNTPAGDFQTNAVAEARKQIQALWDYVENALAKSGTAYLAGNEPTAGDFLLTTIANWNPAAYKFGPKTTAVLKNISARPSYQKALAAEAVEYKAAA